MRFVDFEIVVEKEPEDGSSSTSPRSSPTAEVDREGYSAYSPSLPGCFSNGRTIEETRRNMSEAAALGRQVFG